MAYKTVTAYPDFMAFSINIRYMALSGLFVDKNHVNVNLIRNQPIPPSISQAIQENVIFEKTPVYLIKYLLQFALVHSEDLISEE